jgi:hypothetical protein
MSSDGTTRLIFTMQSDQSTLVANFGPAETIPGVAAVATGTT